MKKRKGTPRPHLAEYNRLFRTGKKREDISLYLRIRWAKVREALLSEPDKLCRGCGQRKPREAFMIQRKTYDGRQSRCAECRRPKNREQINKRRDDAKKKIFIRYGEKCAVCGFSDSRALQIDHINGGGAKSEGTNGTGGYTYLIKVANAPDGQYQILCANCNWIKRHEQKEGPQRIDDGT